MEPLQSIEARGQLWTPWRLHERHPILYIGVLTTLISNTTRPPYGRDQQHGAGRNA